MVLEPAFQCRANHRSSWRTNAVVVLLAGVLLGPGCLLDPHDRCNSNQVLRDGACYCAEGYAPSEDGCVKCGEHEVGNTFSGCICEKGYARIGGSETCTKVTIGQTCTSDAECGGVAPSCHLDGAEGYCTQTGCESSKDCLGTEYLCNRDNAVSFCERPPTGQGEPCTSNTDCEGYEAAYCEIFSRKACIVNECAPNPKKCWGDSACCDITLIAESICIPLVHLEEYDGVCPAGGVLVPRTAGEE